MNSVFNFNLNYIVKNKGIPLCSENSYSDLPDYYIKIRYEKETAYL